MEPMKLDKIGDDVAIAVVTAYSAPNNWNDAQIQAYKKYEMDITRSLTNTLAKEAGSKVEFKPYVTLEDAVVCEKCDYRLEIKMDPSTYKWKDLGWTILTMPFSVLSLTIIPGIVALHYPENDFVLRRCYDDQVISEGKFSRRESQVLWFFNIYIKQKYKGMGKVGPIIAKDQQRKETKSAKKEWRENSKKLIKERYGEMLAQKKRSSAPAYSGGMSPASASYGSGQIHPAVVPAPMSSGKYACPYKSDGTMADWTTRILGAGLGGELTGQAADELTKQAVSQIPGFGGMLSDFAGSAAKSATSSTVKEQLLQNMDADQFFANPCDLSVYMSSQYSGRADYPQALNAVKTVYEDVKVQYDGCVANAVATSRTLPPSMQAAPPPIQKDIVEQLEKLQALFEKGALSKEEFELAKKKLLSTTTGK